MYKILSVLVLLVLFSNSSYAQNIIVQPVVQPVYYVPIVQIPVPVVQIVPVVQQVIIQPPQHIMYIPQNPPITIYNHRIVYPQPRCCLSSYFYRY